jgi:hypothetical protein
MVLVSARSPLQAHATILSRSLVSTRQPSTSHLYSLSPCSLVQCIRTSHYWTRSAAFPLGITAMLAAVALLGSQAPTAMEGASAGPASTALRRDPSVPLRIWGHLPLGIMGELRGDQCTTRQWSRWSEQSGLAARPPRCGAVGRVRCHGCSAPSCCLWSFTPAQRHSVASPIQLLMCCLVSA